MWPGDSALTAGRVSQLREWLREHWEQFQGGRKSWSDAWRKPIGRWGPACADNRRRLGSSAFFRGQLSMGTYQNGRHR